MKNILAILSLLATASAVGCGAIGPLPPAQARLDKADGRPTVFLGEGQDAKASTCRIRNAEIPSPQAAAMEVRLDLTCRSSGSGEPAWSVHVVATCTGGEGRRPCVESGRWDLAFTGKPDGESAVRDLGSATLDAATFFKLKQSYEPQPKTASSGQQTP